MLRNKIVLIIPYFGNKPDYFNLWLKSAEANPDYTFFIYTDLELSVSERSNVKIKKTTFSQLKQRICLLFGSRIVLRTPYKLCDYKPAYGLIFQDDIKEFDFWGFCDIDLIFGNLNHFINDEILDSNEKVFYHGHFSLFKNNERMNHLFLKEYKDVCDFKTASTTNYICHFDESGTVAYAGTNKLIDMYFDWCFYDVPYNRYPFELLRSKEEQALYWNQGTLIRCNSNTEIEVMYAHLQKRKMNGWKTFTDDVDQFGIYRTDFFNCRNQKDVIEKLNTPIDIDKESAFYLRVKRIRRKMIVSNLLSGALKYRIKRILKR